MAQRNINTMKVRLAMQAGWTTEQLARVPDVPVLSCGTGVASGAQRQTGRGRDESAFAVETERISVELNAADPSIPVKRWFMSISRLDVVENIVWSPITHWLDPKLYLTQPRKQWDATVRTWEKEGWKFADVEEIVGSWRPYLEKAIGPDNALVPYVNIRPETRTITTGAFCTDVREPRLHDWMHAHLSRERERTGNNRIIHGIKSGMWENFPSWVSVPQGVYLFDAKLGWQQPKVHGPNPGPLGAPGYLYQPGEHLAAQMRYLARLLDDGFEVIVNEAYAHAGRRWAWEDDHPEVADRLTGELVDRMPWDQPAASS